MKADFVAILRDHAPFGEFRLSLKADFVAILLFLREADSVWACLGLSEPVWACLGLSGLAWACLGLSGPVGADFVDNATGFSSSQ